MAPRSLIIGGTSGLGLCLAQESFKRGIQPVILGRTATALKESLVHDDPLNAAEFVDFDLVDAARYDIARHVDPDHDLHASATHALSTPFLKLLPYTNGWMHGNPISHIFWNAGSGLQQPFSEFKTAKMDELVSLHLTGPLLLLRRLFPSQESLARKGDVCMVGLDVVDPFPPVHLITISSTSAWRSRENELLYCALKAAKSHATRCLAKELTRDLPGSKTTLVQPGGMATPKFWGPLGKDMKGYMNPAVVAEIIWNRATTQLTPFEEYSLMRMDDGSPRVKEGPQLPE